MIFFFFWTHGGVTALSRRWSAAFELDTSTTAVSHLLFCCNSWCMGGSLRGRRCCTTFCCTAVSGWVDRFVAVVCCCRVPRRREFFFVFFFLPLYRPHAGIVQRTTSCVLNSNNTRGQGTLVGILTGRATARVLPGAPRPAADSFCRHRLRGYCSWDLFGGLVPPQNLTRAAATGIQRSNV